AAALGRCPRGRGRARRRADGSGARAARRESRRAAGRRPARYHRRGVHRAARPRARRRHRHLQEDLSPVRALAAPIALAALALAGCAAGPELKPALDTVELTAVPFFPQTEYQCGPAALATVLAHEGLAVTAEQLAPAVYVEGL